MDEPTTGLHFADIHKLLEVLRGFMNAGNTVIVVEHNLDVLKTADWIIDLGPEGGAGGGKIVVEGTPEDVAACAESYTGESLRTVLPGYASGGARSAAQTRSGKGKEKERPQCKENGRHHGPRSRPALAVCGRAEQRQPPQLRATNEIVIRGAAQHNLQYVDVDVPREKISVFGGAEQQRQNVPGDGHSLRGRAAAPDVESLSAYARQFLGQMPKPKVEHIHGLSPAIAIEQKRRRPTRRGPPSAR